MLASEPPRRLVIGSDISPTWQIETKLEKISEVEMCFVSEGENRTRVRLAHRNLDRQGDGWRMLPDDIVDDGGWPLYLQRFVEMAGTNR